jgi:hypothetical protein
MGIGASGANAADFPADGRPDLNLRGHSVSLGLTEEAIRIATLDLMRCENEVRNLLLENERLTKQNEALKETINATFRLGTISGLDWIECRNRHGHLVDHGELGLVPGPSVW